MSAQQFSPRCVQGNTNLASRLSDLVRTKETPDTSKINGGVTQCSWSNRDLDGIALNTRRSFRVALMPMVRPHRNFSGSLLSTFCPCSGRLWQARNGTTLRFRGGGLRATLCGTDVVGPTCLHGAFDLTFENTESALEGIPSGSCTLAFAISWTTLRRQQGLSPYPTLHPAGISSLSKVKE